jgi:hypothetical protein
MDAVSSLLQAVDQVSWSSYVGPDYYDPSEPPRAFRHLVSAQNEDDGRAAYDEMLFAIGNNHAGSYYAAARPAVPLLVRAAVTLSGWPRAAAVEALTDLIMSFGPEDGQTKIGDVFLKAVEEHAGHSVADTHAALELLRKT